MTVTTPPPGGRLDRDVHRALSSPQRVRIVELLRAHDEPLGIDDLAGTVGLHPNTVRAHLAVLEQAALVSAEPETRHRPGRPRILYRSVPGAQDAGDGGSYRLLADILASHLAGTSPDAAAAAEAAGRAWGRHLVESPRPFERPDADAVLAGVTGLLDRIGFAPVVDRAVPASPRVDLHRCPFRELAREHQQVVCSVHLGLMRGAVEELGGAVSVDELVPFVEPMRCTAHLAVRP